MGDLDDNRDVDRLPSNQARPGQGRHGGPIYLSPDMIVDTWGSATAVPTTPRQCGCSLGPTATCPTSSHSSSASSRPATTAPALSPRTTDGRRCAPRPSSSGEPDSSRPARRPRTNVLGCGRRGVWESRSGIRSAPQASRMLAHLSGADAGRRTGRVARRWRTSRRWSGPGRMGGEGCGRRCRFGNRGRFPIRGGTRCLRVWAARATGRCWPATSAPARASELLGCGCRNRLAGRQVWVVPRGTRLRHPVPVSPEAFAYLDEAGLSATGGRYGTPAGDSPGR